MNTSRTLASRAVGAATLAVLLALAGCGGGGDSAPTNGPAATGTGAGTSAGSGAAAEGGTAAAGSANTTSPGSAAAAAPTSAGSTCAIADFAVTALARINQLRAAGANCRTAGTFPPAGPLTWSPLLTQSAEGLSQDMAAKNFFAHTGSGGSTLATRVDATGYAWSQLGENIAAGYIGLDAVMAGWAGSDGHCANLMKKEFNQIGLVCVPGNAGTAYSNYWTMDLALSK